MIFRDLEFFITEAFIGMRRSSLMIFIAIATITVSLVIFGFFLLLTANINNLADVIIDKLEIRVYLKPALAKREVVEFEEKLNALPGVKSVTFIDRETAWKNFKDSYANLPLSDMIEHNPLPDGFQVRADQTSQIHNLSKTISGLTYYVDDVVDGGELGDRIQSFAEFTRIGGLILVVIFCTATLLIVMNTIRLTILARQDEISIMQLVGATNPFIQWPFIIEGLFIGVGGSILSVVVLKSTYIMMGTKFQESIPFFPLVYDSQTLNAIYIFLGVVGTILGVLGAYVSVSRSLKYVKPT